jgi:uncharacterized RDD family membrane protein YckC
MLRPVRAVAAPTLERAIDGILASPLPEALAQSLVEHRVLQRMAAKSLGHADVERAVREILRSPALDRALHSPEFERVLGEILASPQVRQALAQQSTSLAAELEAGARRAAARLDDAVERRPRRWLRRAPRTARSTSYAGVATRGVALAIDATLVTLVFLTGTALVELVTTLVGQLRPVWLAETIAGASWLALLIGYFAGFWAAAGQTPGMRVMHARVLDRENRRRPGFGRSLLRLAGLLLAIIPCFAGFLPALVDDRRRALHDFIAGTVVVYGDEGSSQTDEALRPPPS